MKFDNLLPTTVDLDDPRLVAELQRLVDPHAGSELRAIDRELVRSIVGEEMDKLTLESRVVITLGLGLDGGRALHPELLMLLHRATWPRSEEKMRSMLTRRSARLAETVRERLRSSRVR